MQKRYLLLTALGINRFNNVIGRSIAWLVLVMVITMCTSVILRYAFGATMVWQTDLIRYCHSLVFLLAAGYTLRDNKHVRIDIFYQRRSKRGQAIVDIVGTILFLWPFCIAIAYYSTDFIADSWGLMEHSAEYGGLPGVYLLKTCIWCYCLTLGLQGISTILHAVERLHRA